MIAKMLGIEHLEATVKVLEHTVDHTVSNHSADPKETLLRPADHEVSHALLARHFPHEYMESIESKWHMGNFVIDRKTGEKHFEDMSIYVRLGMHLLYYGSEQEKALHWKKTLDLLEAQSVKMGKEYDDPASKDHIQPFIESFKLQDTLQELKKPNPEDYSCFNEFFARELKDGARPVEEPENPKVVSSPADCRLTAFPSVDLATKYWIKGFGFTLGKLLGDEELAQKFDGGTIMIARLAPQDYHRWHAPINGTVQSVKTIPGAYYTVNPQAVNEEGTVDVFCENKRSVMLISRKETETPVAVIAVGAMLVGSIKYNDGLDQPGTKVARGQCLGAFMYGGSTVIVLYPKGEVVLDEDLVKNSMEQHCETLVSVGWRVGAGPS
jgi:phosphatidylserine decarboxylase